MKTMRRRGMLAALALAAVAQWSAPAAAEIRWQFFGGLPTTHAYAQQIMAGLDLPYPKFIDHALPGNRLCGVCPDDLPAQMQAYCGRMTESPQG